MSKKTPIIDKKGSKKEKQQTPDRYKNIKPIKTLKERKNDK